MLLAHTTLHAPGHVPRKQALFLHGILGRGSNWQSFARRLCERRPEWGAVLVDLPEHGDSGRLRAEPTLAAVAAEVRSSMQALGGVQAVIGHSFGGKVALELVAHAPERLRQIWVLDSSPGPRAERSPADVTRKVLAALCALPATFASRGAFIGALEQRGIAAAVARWLAKNLVRSGDAFRFGLDLDAIARLIADYDRQDLWPVVDAAAGHVAMRFVLAGRGSAVPASDRERLRHLQAGRAIELYELPNAGHWLHVDDPEGLLELFAARFS